MLVHGSWQGGWCWQRVAPRLENAGHRVYAPTLTGLGERAHLASPAVDLETQTLDVVNVLRYEDLADVVLVGHSYAGIVIPSVVNQVPERVGRLVYLEAAMARDGESLATLLGPELAAGLEQTVNEQGDGWREPPVPLELLQVTDPDDVAWMEPKLTWNMYAPQIQPVRLDNPAAADVPRTFIWGDDATGAHEASPFFPVWKMFLERAEAEGWPIETVATGHQSMVTAPGELAETLVRIATP